MNINEAQPNSMGIIELNNAFDTLEFSKRKELLALCLSKLRLKGRLTYRGLDLGEVTRGYESGYIELEQMNELIGGVKSMSTIDYEIEKLKALNLKVEIKRLNNYEYYLEAVRELG